MSIFKDGYLKPEYLNSNYRGLVGWDAEVSNIIENIISISDFMIHCSSGSTFMCFQFLKKTKIKQFTPKDIPVGELCWVAERAHYMSTDLILLSVDKNTILRSEKYYCVPYLIAETAEQAENLKNWSEDEKTNS